MKKGSKKKAMVVSNIVMLVLALIVIAIMAFLAYKYILGTGEQIGSFSGCASQSPGSACVKAASECTGGRPIYKLGCPPADSAGKVKPEDKDKLYCCVKDAQ